MTPHSFVPAEDAEEAEQSVAWSRSRAEPQTAKTQWLPSESFTFSPPTGPIQGCLPLFWNILSPDIPSISTTLGLGNILAQSELSNTLSSQLSRPGAHVHIHIQLCPPWLVTAACQFPCQGLLSFQPLLLHPTLLHWVKHGGALTSAVLNDQMHLEEK